MVEHFDLVTGTSTGGIIALALGAGLSPRRVIEFYETYGSRVFARSGLRRLKHPFRAKVEPGWPYKSRRPIGDATDDGSSPLRLRDALA